MPIWGALGGAIAGLAGSGISAGVSAHIASENRKFQERMYKHRYQYQVDDLKKAGLNPALAYGQAPPGPPGGAMAQIPDFGASVSKGSEAGTKQKQLEEMEKTGAAQRIQLAAAADQSSAQAELARAQAKSMGVSGAVNEGLVAEWDKLTPFQRKALLFGSVAGSALVGGGAAGIMTRGIGMGGRAVKGALQSRKVRGNIKPEDLIR